MDKAELKKTYEEIYALLEKLHDAHADGDVEIRTNDGELVKTNLKYIRNAFGDLTHV